MYHVHFVPLLAQLVNAASTTTPPPATSNSASPGAAFVPSAIGASAAFAYFMNWLKNWQKFPLITQHSSEINAAFRAVTSFFATVGITVVWTGHTLSFGNIYLWTIVSGLGHWFSTYAIQHGWEKIFSIVTPVNVPKLEHD